MMSFLENFVSTPQSTRVERVYNFNERDNKNGKNPSDVLMKYSANLSILV